jgi:predicted NBD/HSP70 family sugar kinase
VLTQLRELGTARVADLVSRTGLTRPTVTQALGALERGGWVETASDGTAGPRMGRPAQMVRFRAEAGHVVGVDVGPHKIVATVADLAGRILAQHRQDTRKPQRGTDVVASVISVVAVAIQHAAIDHDAVQAVAVGTPGIVDSARGTVLMAPSIAGWAGLPLGAELNRRFACPVHIDNDINLAVLAEHWRGGVGDDARTIVFIQWGARIGAGIMIDGTVYRGSAAAAGEIGFLDLSERPSARLGADRLGPFEKMVGVETIVGLARKAARRPGSRLHDLLHANTDPLDAAPVFEAATAGDQAALAVVDEIAARFARGVAPVFLLLDPDLVTIGGGVSHGGTVLLDAVERHLRERTLMPPRLTLSSLGDAAVTLGAVRRALDDLDDRLLSPAALAASATA